jgi:hypothetical protein
MRQDHDYVSFADYEKDMRETADKAANVIRTLIMERDEARIMLWAAVAAAGGRLSIGRNLIGRWLPKEWKVSDDIVNNAVVLTTKNP